MDVENVSKSTGNESGIFYGYFIVGASFLTLTVIWGSYYAFGVFFKPLLTEFGWTRAMVAGAASLAMIINGLLGIAMGGLTDRFGPRLVMTSCGILIGFGYFLMSQVSAVWQLYLFYGIILGIGMSGSFIPLASTVARWFVERRGIMTGIIVAGVGIGAFIGPPAAVRLISRYGWRSSYMIMGCLVLVVVVLAAQFVKRDPAHVGLTAYGEKKESPKEVMASKRIPENKDLSLKEALYTARFWGLSAVFFCFGFCLHSIMIHIVPHASELGFSPAVAANMLATIGGLSILGKLLFGMVGDNVGSRNIFIISFIFMSSALLWLLSAHEMWMLFVFSAAFGFAYGGSVVSHSPLIADLFGLSSHGIIMGACGVGITLGGATGPLLTGYIFDITGSYQSAFMICVVISTIGVLLSISIKRPAVSKSS